MNDAMKEVYIFMLSPRHGAQRLNSNKEWVDDKIPYCKCLIDELKNE